jgi:hypothetical protein
MTTDPQGAATPRQLRSGATLILGWLGLAALANGLLWMALVPPWQTPDEPKHFEYVRLLAEGDRLVAFADEAAAADPELQAAIVQSMDEHAFWWYGHAPGYDPAQPAGSTAGLRFADLWLGGSHTAFYRSSPVYYWLAAQVQPADRLAGLYAARLLSVLLGVLAVLLAGWAAREVFPEDPFVRYGAPVFVAFHPMFAFLSSGVNNDVLLNALAMFVFLLVCRLLARGASPARLLLLAAAIVAAVAVKRTALFLVPTALVALLAWLALRGRRHGTAIAAALGSLGVLVVGGWVWWTSGGAGSIPGTIPQAWRWNLQRYFFNEPDQLDRILAYLRAPEIGPILVEYQWGLLGDFWGSFGWQLVRFPAWLYVGLGILTLVALAGALRRMIDADAPAHQRATLVTSAAAVGLAAAAATAFFVSYLNLPYPPAPQGRYLYAALGPIAILFTAGLGAWIPLPRRVTALKAFTAGMVAFDLVALFGFVVPYFYR